MIVSKQAGRGVLAVPAGVGLREQAVSGMLWSAGSRLLTQVLDQVFTVVLVRMLAPRDFGLMAMSAVFTSLLNVFADMGLARAVVQREKIDEEYLSTAFWGNVASGFVMCGLALAGAAPIARLYDEPMAGAILAALSLRFLFAGGSATHVALLTRQMKFGALTTRAVVSTVVGGTVGVVLVLKGAGVWSLVGQALATSLSRAVLLWVATSWRPRRLFSWEKARDLWSFGGQLLGARIFSYVVKQSDNFLIARMLGPAMLGYYAFAYGLFLAPLIDISLIVGRVTLPAFSRLQRDIARLRQGFVETSTYVSMFGFPAIVGFFLVAPDLVAVIFGDKWLPAVPALRTLLVAGFLSSHTNIWQSVFQAMNKPAWVLLWAFVSACVYVPAFVVGVRWGIAGVAAGYLASTLLLVPIQLMLVQKLLSLRMRDYLARFVPVVAASAAMAAIVYGVQHFVPGEGMRIALRLGLSITAGGLTYLIGIFLMQRDLLTALIRILTRLRRTRTSELAGETV